MEPYGKTPYYERKVWVNSTNLSTVQSLELSAKFFWNSTRLRLESIQGPQNPQTMDAQSKIIYQDFGHKIVGISAKKVVEFYNVSNKT